MSRMRAYDDTCQEADCIIAAYVISKHRRLHLARICDIIVSELGDDIILDDDTPLALLQRVRAVIAGLPHQPNLANPT